MNEFSLLCRILGTLFYRQPDDLTVKPLWNLLAEGKLNQHWPLEQDELLAQLQRPYERAALNQDYQQLFLTETPAVTPYGHEWPNGPEEADVASFLTARGMPLAETPADHFGRLLLAASWLEDNAADDENQAIMTLFEEFLLPWCGAFLGKVEAHAQTGFYRALAMTTRGAVQAMAEELLEVDDTEDEQEA
ncbi:molecular chaperone [Rosenbergiella australiborealis]|uniref:Molecular chaperone n=1 Tax=Rosenbergiella australiborealis TaxID=1544696 RepID=A0ABS5T2H7_9GAMM|nr:molecular chaperone [Rosenbergiella australiborealis]MBT0726560.1 molecular chaperone [Rosenbergiella australiborealis]